jgi:hypothetical protein
MQSIKLDVFGRLVIATHTDEGWKMFYAGAEGKRRPATDIIVPAEVSESNLETYLADLCHEWCTVNNPVVKRLL